MRKAVVVGSGPNGLAAAIELARAGCEVTVLEANSEPGGGARSWTDDNTGLTFDHCAAIHPLSVASDVPFEDLGVEWRTAPVDCAHPLDSGDAVLLKKSIQDTARGLGGDGKRWVRLFNRSVENFEHFSSDVMSPVIHKWKSPANFMRFGLISAPPPALLHRYFRTERAKALLSGIAAHAMQPQSTLLTSGVAAGLIVAGHVGGWRVAKGGTGTVVASMVRELEHLSVKLELGVRVREYRQLPPHDLVLFDTHPLVMSRILGDRLTRRQQARYERYRSGPGVFKIDLVVDGEIPWKNSQVSQASTVHLGGSAAEIADVERAVSQGLMPIKPFTLVTQQAAADPTRAAGSLQPISAYAHVPNGYDGDVSFSILQQIERFAPGARDRVLSIERTSPGDLARDNENFAGGDILTGAMTPAQFLFGPNLGIDPYYAGTPGVFLCSAAVPPGPGVHGMSGVLAARRALKDLKTQP